MYFQMRKLINYIQPIPCIYLKKQKKTNLYKKKLNKKKNCLGVK